MPNQLWRNPRSTKSKDLQSLALGILIFGIIGYLLFPNLFKDISSLNNPTADAASINDVNLPRTNEPYALNSSSSTSQLFPSATNTINIGSGNNAISSGYWVLFVSNGTSQQLPINAQDYAYLQRLIQSDSKGSATVTIFLINNGQIHQYVISNEVYSVISNIATINTRASNTPTYTTPPTIIPPTPAPLTPTISETLTVSYPSTTGFTVDLSPALNGLTINNFTLVNSSGNLVALTGATPSVGGAAYSITAALVAGQTYTLTAAYAGYSFGTGQNVVVPL
ncbi:MAG: hypothetical protein WA131_12625 [Desulfitobacteriaceae bacterium]